MQNDDIKFSILHTPSTEVEEAGGLRLSQSLAGVGDNSRHNTYMYILYLKHEDSVHGYTYHYCYC